MWDDRYWGMPYKKVRSILRLRQQHMAEINDPSLRLPPRPPKPPRRDKRRPTRPR